MHGFRRLQGLSHAIWARPSVDHIVSNSWLLQVCDQRA